MTDKKPSKKEKQSQREAILDNQEVLAAELTYIGQTAFQTNEDRQRVGQFFFISFGSFIAAILSLQVETESQTEIFLILGFVFLFVTVFGVSTLLQLTRLREAWLESVQAMNKIKLRIEENYKPALDDIFVFRDAPSAYKSGSVGFYQSLQVALGTGVASGATLAFFLLAALPEGAELNAIISGVVLCLLSTLVYFHWLYRKPLSNWMYASTNE